MNLSDAPSFISATALQHEIRKYSYRPGWELSVFMDPWEGPCLYVRATVLDGYDPSKKVELRIRSAIPPIPSFDYFGQWLLWRLAQIESHECREYLHYEGKPLVDPHDPVEPDPKEQSHG